MIVNDGKFFKHRYQRDIIQDSQRSLDFEKDVRDWKGLYKLALQLKSQALFELQLQQQGPHKNSPQLKLFSPDIKTDLITFKSLIIPDSGFGYYLDALYREWIGDREEINKFHDEKESRGEPWEYGDDRELIFNLGHERFNSYKESAEKGYPRAQEKYSLALLHGWVGEFFIGQGRERFQELLKKEKAGDKTASHWINIALYFGKLDQDMREAKERFKDLLLIGVQ